MVNYDMCLRASEEIGPINALAGSADEPFALLKVVYAIYAHYCYSALSHPIQVPPTYHLPTTCHLKAVPMLLYHEHFAINIFLFTMQDKPTHVNQNCLGDH